MFVDSVTGALGGGLVNPVIRVGSRANKMVKYSGRRGYQVGASAVDDIMMAGYVTAPMVSRPVRMELVAGGVASVVYDIAYKSSGSSSERNGTHVGPGDTSSGKKAKGPESYGNLSYKPGFRTGRRGPCDPGYLLQKKSNGSWACVRLDKHRYVR